MLAKFYSVQRSFRQMSCIEFPRVLIVRDTPIFEGSQNWLPKAANIDSPSRLYRSQRPVIEAITLYIILLPHLKAALQYITLGKKPFILLLRCLKMDSTARAQSNIFYKRRPNLIKKCYELAHLCNANIALIIRKKGIYYTYCLLDND